MPRLQSNIQRQTFSKICEEQLHLNTALVSTRACGYFLFKKRKKLLKNRVPEMSLLRASRSFFQDPLQILLTKHRMYLRLKPAQMPFGKSPPNLGQTDRQTNTHTKSIRSVALDLGSPLRGQLRNYSVFWFFSPLFFVLRRVVLKAN